jgi:hypothetical protein
VGVAAGTVDAAGLPANAAIPGTPEHAVSIKITTQATLIILLDI